MPSFHKKYKRITLQVIILIVMPGLGSLIGEHSGDIAPGGAHSFNNLRET